jgi:hypothetical protein
MYKSYWAQWKSLAMRNNILEHNWKYTNRQSQIAQIVLPWSRVKDVMTKLHGESSGQQNPEKGSATVLLAPGMRRY